MRDIDLLSSRCRLGVRILCFLATTSFLLPTINNSTNAGIAIAAPLSHNPLSRHPSFQSKRQEEPDPVLLPGTEPNVEEDPCKTLGRLEEPDITFAHVKKCYENIRFNATEASNVLSTLYTFFKDYYIFLDAAMLDNHPKPFTTPPVDILAGFDILSRQQYHGDFEFQTTVDNLVNTLNDAHANYL
ncbi:hypothetical protein BGX21_010967, partial [Mortierella sp. AD011]